jgi:hypothetical protein
MRQVTMLSPGNWCVTFVTGVNIPTPVMLNVISCHLVPWSFWTKCHAYISHMLLVCTVQCVLIPQIVPHCTGRSWHYSLSRPSVPHLYRTQLQPYNHMSPLETFVPLMQICRPYHTLTPTLRNMPFMLLHQSFRILNHTWFVQLTMFLVLKVNLRHFMLIFWSVSII